MAVMSVQTDAVVFRFGTQSLKCITGSTGDNAVYPADPVAVQPGEDRTFSAYIKTNAAMTGGSIYLRVAQGGLFTPTLIESDPVVDTSVEAAANEDGWLRLIVTLTIPDGVFTVRPYIQYSGATADQIFWVDGIKFERGAVASIWQENIVSRRAVVDQSGFIVDASQGGIVRYLGATGGDRDTVQLGDHGFQFGGDTEAYSDATGQITVEAPSGAAAIIRALSGGAANSARFQGIHPGDTNPRFSTIDNKIQLGPGDAAEDVILRRNAAKELTIDTDGAGGDLDLVTVNAKGIAGVQGPIRHVYTSNTTWNKPAGIHHIEVEVVGGGAGGGSSQTCSSTQASVGGSGGGGGYARKLLTAADLASDSTYTVTVGQGGAGGTAGTDNAADGGASSFAGTGITTVQGNGGAGGNRGGLSTGNGISAAGGSGGTASGGDINVQGGHGSNGTTLSGVAQTSDFGGSSHLAGSVKGTATANGNGSTGQAYGGGGTGAHSSTSNGGRPGGAGADGVVIVTEYYAP